MNLNIYNNNAGVFLHVCFQTLEHQAILCSNGAIASLAPLLTCNIYRVRLLFILISKINNFFIFFLSWLNASIIIFSLVYVHEKDTCKLFDQTTM